MAGPLFEEMKVESVFHFLAWTSKKSRRPVKSNTSPDILAAYEAVEVEKVLSNRLKKLLDVHVDLWIAIDSKDLY